MKLFLITCFLFASILVIESYSYNKYNNYDSYSYYPTSKRSKPICPYKRVGRLISSNGMKRCVKNYGTECCNLVNRLAKAKTELETSTNSTNTTNSTSTVNNTSTANNTTKTNSTSTTTSRYQPYVGSDNSNEDLIVSVGDSLEVDPVVNSSENDKKSEPLKSLSAIQTSLRDQITKLLAQIDQTKNLLERKEMEMREARQKQEVPVVNAADILKITNSRLSSTEALKTLKILAFQKITQHQQSNQ